MLAAWLGAIALASPVAAQDPAARVEAISATLEAEHFDAVALVTGAPGRVVFEIVPVHVTPAPPPTRVDAVRRPARPQAVAAFGPSVAQWVARLPAPARFGAFRGRVLAYDAAGTELARSDADWARSFPARVEVTPLTPTIDVTTAPGEGVLRIEVGGAERIDAIAIQTNAHANVELGFGSLPYAADLDARTHGRTFPAIGARLARLGPARFELRFAVPAGTPPRVLGIDRVILRSGSGHTAEGSVRPGAVVRVIDAAPRPAALDVRAERDGRRIEVTFRYEGPLVGRARTFIGLPVPNVEVQLRDRARLVRGRCVPREIPTADPTWDGATMRCRLGTTTRGDHPLGPETRLAIVAGGDRIGEAPLAELLGP